MKKSVFFLALLAMCVVSCNGPGPVGPPKTTPIDIQNVLWALPVGPLSNPDINNYPDIRIKIKVQAVNGNGNAVLYKSYDKTYAQSFSSSKAWFRENIEVPSSGSFVIQVEVIGLECTWVNASCTAQPFSSKQEYFRQETYNTGTPSLFTFPITPANKITETCGC